MNMSRLPPSDHWAIGDPVKGDSIYNGRVTMRRARRRCSEMRGRFPSLHPAPRARFFFIAVTGEEEGCWVPITTHKTPRCRSHRSWPTINMDEVSFLYDFRTFVPLGGEHSSLGAVAMMWPATWASRQPDPLPEEVISCAATSIRSSCRAFQLVYRKKDFRLESQS